MESVKYWVALNMVLGVGKTLFHRLVGALGSPEKVFGASPAELMGVEGIGKKTAAEIKGFNVDAQVEREFRLAEKLEIRILTVESPEFPSLLREIYDPPPIIYCRGIPLDRFAVPLAVVGTRVPSAYGKMATERICDALASRGITVVSGFARGIDTLAHNSALKAGGMTAAVFGCGLNHTYPPENSKLKDKILQNGAIISEFPISAGPERNNFPARNRIISGMSHGSIIVEAGEKSGALITAQFALEQGREVFSVPGNIFSPNSRGTNRLIKTGAKLIDGLDAIIEELPLAAQAKLRDKSSASPVEKQSLSEKEKMVISLLSFEERHIDSLIESSRLSPAEVSATLVQLELRGLVRQMEGKRFVSV